MRTNLTYILVDDDNFNNVLNSLIIEETLSVADIKVFTRPLEALEFIQKETVVDQD